MEIIRNNKFVKNKYSLISSCKELDKKKFVLFDSKFWEENNILLKKSNKKLGILFNSDESAQFIYNDYKYFNLIQINFLTFKDGRPFTIAKKLKNQSRYKNEIRASGYVLPDQYIFLLRCGFHSVEIKGSQKITWKKIFEDDPGLYYQK